MMVMFLILGMPPASLLSMYGMGMGLGGDAKADEETAKALAAATTSAHSAFPFQMYNPMLAYSSMLAAQAQNLGLGTSQSYAAQAALSSAGMWLYSLFIVSTSLFAIF